MSVNVCDQFLICFIRAFEKNKKQGVRMYVDGRIQGFCQRPTCPDRQNDKNRGK